MNILILRPDHIGDMLLTTPLLSLLRKSFPGWHITIVSSSWALPVLEYNPNIDEIVVCDYPWLARGRKASWIQFIQTVVDLRLKKYDIVFNLRKAAKAASIARAINGKQIWGFDVGKSAWAHTNKITYRTDCHIADLYLEFAYGAGAKSKKNEGLQLFLQEEDFKSLGEILEIPDKYVVLAPGAGYPEKLWVNEHWAKTGDWIMNELKTPVIITGSKQEGLLSKSIMDRMIKKPVDATGKLSVRQLASLIKNAQYVVSVDSAAMHIASAVKTPVGALFGPTNPVHWGPYPNGRANQVLSKVKEFKLGRGSTNKSGGMDLLTVEDVRSSIKILCEAENSG